MSNSLSNSKQQILAAEAMVLQSAEFFRSAVNSQGRRSKQITFNKAQIDSQLEKIYSLCEQLSTVQGDKCPLDAEIYVANQKFLKKADTITLNELSSGNIRHINLSQVTKLEQQLVSLYGQIKGLQQQLDTNSTPTISSSLEVLKSALPEVCDDLLTLSLLIPNVPWSRKRALPEVSIDSLMASLPKLSTTKHQEVRSLMATVLKLAEHRYQLQAAKLESLEKKLSYFTSSEQSDSKIVEQSLDCILHQHNIYHQDLHDTLVQPLCGVLDTFSQLADDPTDTTLKKFLSDFKAAAPQMKDVCQTIQSHDMNTTGVDQLKTDYEKKIKKSLAKLKLIQENQEDKENEHRQMECEIRDELLAILPQVTVKNTKREASKPKVKLPSVDSSIHSPQPLTASAASFVTRLEHHNDIAEDDIGDCDECGQLTSNTRLDVSLGASVHQADNSHKTIEVDSRKQIGVSKNISSDHAIKKPVPSRKNKGARGVAMSTLRLVRDKKE